MGETSSDRDVYTNTIDLTWLRKFKGYDTCLSQLSFGERCPQWGGPLLHCRHAVARLLRVFRLHAA